MDYEKRYNETLERARKEWVENLDNCYTNYRERLEIIFPELKESEGERIRKELICFVENWEKYNPNSPFDDYAVYTSDRDECDKILAWLEKQVEPEDKGEISDGYHTFNELYKYRMLYNAAFFNLLPKQLVHKSKKHHDGKECFGGGWFIVMANLPTGQISNHYELKDWDLFQIPEKEIADEWDGHTPQEAAERLHKYLLKKQCVQKPIEPLKLSDIDKAMVESRIVEDLLIMRACEWLRGRLPLTNLDKFINEFKKAMKGD